MATAISTILIFLLVILIHELGHFLVAKAVGIAVHEFSIGMGPKIFQKTKNETEYTLRLFPVGGYVSMEGEDEETEDPRGFSNASKPKQIAVLLAGAFMNFLLAIVVLSIVFFNTGIPSSTIDEILEDSPAYHSELEVGDKVVRINSKKIRSWKDITTEIDKSSDKDELEIEILRDGESLRTEVRPSMDEGRPIIGIVPGREKSFFGSIKMSFTQTGDVIKNMFKFLGMLFTGKLKGDVLSGPVGVVSEVGKAASAGIIDILLLLALISINLGFFNLLPIPALDGGRIFFILIELVRGKPLDPEKEGVVHLIGFVLLMGLMIFVTYKDIVNLIIKR